MVIVDTSVVQYLHQLGLLSLLERLYGRVVIPRAVVAELAEGQTRGVDLPEVSRLSWVDVVNPAAAQVLALITDLGAGERDVLAVALENPGSTVVLDDRLARMHAARVGIRVTGTLGVLAAAKSTGLVPAVRPLLDRLEELGFRLDPKTRNVVLISVGEQ